nr:MAG TPA: hypothetical protein [Bacteriophage sp.]
MTTTVMAKLRALPLRSMNAYVNVYNYGAGAVYELVSYCTAVTWAIVDYKGNVDCIVYGPCARCSSTTSRHVSTFVHEVLHVDAPIPSKKSIDALDGKKVLYTYPGTEATDTDFIGDFGDAIGLPHSLRLGKLLPARKAFYNGGHFVPGGDWRNVNA